MTEELEKNETFEEKMKRLEIIIEKLDNEDVALEESLELYKTGVTLSKECSEILKNAELKVTELEENDDDS